MTHFALMRHGRTLWNIEKKIQGREDLPLSRQGEIQVLKWAKALTSFPFDRILSSPMIRARQTSGIMARNLELDIDLEPDLREQDFGQWEGQTIQGLRFQYPGMLEIQENRGWDFCPPQGESRRRVLKRAMAGLTRAAQKSPGARYLVITHNSVMKCLIYHAMGLSFEPVKKSVIFPYHLHYLSVPVDMTSRKAGPMMMGGLNALDLEMGTTVQIPDRPDLGRMA